MCLSPVLADFVFARDGATEVVVFASLLEGFDGFLSDNVCDVLSCLYLKFVVDVSNEGIVVAPDVAQLSQVFV